jgi:hypothetical protein
MAQFDEAMTLLAAPIAAAACDRESLPEPGEAGALRIVGRSLGIGTDRMQGARKRASQAMATRVDDALRRTTDQVIALYGLEGRATYDVLGRLARGVTLDAPLDEAKAAMMGGVVSGALTGLIADLAAGGLTFGAGLLTGALLGALGG